MSVSEAAMARFAGASTDLRLRVDAIGDCRPPLVLGAHAHEFFALLYFTQPGSWHELAGARQTAVPGDLFAVPPGAVHDVAAGGGSAITFMPDAAQGPRSPSVARRLVVPVADRRPLRWLIDRLARELREERPEFRAAARAQLSLLMIAVSRLSPREATPRDPVVGEVLDLIERGFHGPLSLQAIAAHVSRSPRHLSRTVRDLTGATVMDLVDERRMVEARRLLLETNAKVTEIAHSVGFHDDGYFRRRFHRAHGVSPRAWRQGNT